LLHHFLWRWRKSINCVFRLLVERSGKNSKQPLEGCPIGTLHGSVERLFIDGAEIATHSAPGALLTGTGPVRIGGNSLRGEFFSGRIDEVRIYDRALSAARIGADMNASVSP